MMGLSSLVFTEFHSLGFSDLIVFVAPLWIAVAAGVLVGWVWRPKWAYLDSKLLSNSPKFLNLQLPTSILKTSSHHVNPR